MATRSWLFVPGDSERKLAKAATCGADAVVIDLEDAVAPMQKPAARVLAADWLEAHRRQILSGGNIQRWVRINPIDSPFWREDLARVVPTAPDGIFVPKAGGPDQLQILAAELYELELRNSLPTGSTRLVPQLGETAEGAINIAAYAAIPIPRLGGLTWGAEDLALSVGASRKQDEAGNWTAPFAMVRSHVLLAAHARGVWAIDTLFADFRDGAGLERAARRSAADGFSGMLAIHPDQIPAINAAFSLSEAAFERAQAIVDAFSAEPSAGVLEVEGTMIDQPHLVQARRLLENRG